jgi:hypothetical protein
VVGACSSCLKGGKGTPPPMILLSNLSDKLSSALKIFYLYLSVIGIFSFSLFICEESIQMNTFANFSCTDTNRYDLVKKNIDQITVICGHMRWINKILMCMQPFQWLAYEDYIESSETYVESMQAAVLAHDPGLYEGEKLGFEFYYKDVFQTSESNHKYTIRSGKLEVSMDEIPKNPVWVEGVITQKKPNRWIIK